MNHTPTNYVVELQPDRSLTLPDEIANIFIPSDRFLVSTDGKTVILQHIPYDNVCNQESTPFQDEPNPETEQIEDDTSSLCSFDTLLKTDPVLRLMGSYSGQVPLIDDIPISEDPDLYLVAESLGEQANGLHAWEIAPYRYTQGAD